MAISAFVKYKPFVWTSECVPAEAPYKFGKLVASHMASAVELELPLKALMSACPFLLYHQETVATWSSCTPLFNLVTVAWLEAEVLLPEVVAVIVAVHLLFQINGDGETNWLEGVQLLSVYLILGILFFYLPERAHEG